MPGELILVVDDTPVNLKLTRILLTSEGYEVLAATTAEEALEMLEQHRPRLILTDIQLPGIDGLELTRRVKGDPRTRDILVVALTAFAMKGDEANAMEAGCDGYITKPIDTRALGLRIRECLNREAAGEPEDPQPTTVPVAPDFGDLQQRFLEEVHVRVEQWLVDLDGRFDAREAADAVHQWAGASGLLGFREIGRLVSELLAALRERPLDNAQLREALAGLLTEVRVAK